LAKAKISHPGESRIPKPTAKLSAAISKIPKPSFRLLGKSCTYQGRSVSPNGERKTPLLEKLYNLSRPSSAAHKEPPLPKLDLANLKLFDDMEEGEFDDDLGAQLEISRFLSKYKVFAYLILGKNTTIKSRSYDKSVLEDIPLFD
jgi:hypothetical protein